ncbi:hypothetical protein CELL_00259 [Cellulomonas sp. T2.31MG-18]|uniref:hypothetical protein n=1 Tax=Cellulomonas sp. T2.31MG-18 TaxID=3157619 RepID=UPI0035E7936A
MRTFRRSAATIGLAIAIAGVATPAFAGVDPALNHESYWEQNGLYTCTKVELTDGTTTASVPAGAAFIVVKAGTEVTQVWPGIYGGVYSGDKDISFIITCWPIYHS